MRHMLLSIIMVLSFLLWMDPTPGWRSILPPDDSADAGTVSLRDLVPATALLALEIRDLDRRWVDIRSIPAVAKLQDGVLSCAGISPEAVPKLAGDRAVLFLAPSEAQPFVMPIAVLRPAVMREAEHILEAIPQLSYRHAQGALWVGPIGAQEVLERSIRDRGPRLSKILPLDEVDAKLPGGGLVRGWLNPAACVELLQNSRMDVLPLPLRWAAASLGAELTAVRYAAFRRDFEHGELVSDGVVAYDTARLPSAVAPILNPSASPTLIPAELPAETLAIVAFRPEAQAWIPWLRFLGDANPRGPLRNLGFWIDEFQHRYRRDLERDLTGALGERGWFLALDVPNSKPEFVAILEIREASSLEPTLRDLFSWMGEQLWLGTFGIVLPKPWVDMSGGHVVNGMTLRTPFANIPWLNFEVTAQHLVIATSLKAMQVGRAFGETLQRAETGSALSGNGSPAHASVWVDGTRAARRLTARADGAATDPVGCLCNAVARVAAEMLSLRAEMHYQSNAVQLRGRLQFRGGLRDPGD